MFPWIGDFASEGARSNRGRGGEEHLRFLVAHATGEIAIGGADAFHRGIHTAESIHRATETGSATSVFSHLDASGKKNVPNRLLAPAGSLQIVDDFGRGRDAKGIDSNALALQHTGEFEKVAGFAARA